MTALLLAAILAPVTTIEMKRDRYLITASATMVSASGLGQTVHCPDPDDDAEWGLCVGGDGAYVAWSSIQPGPGASDTQGIQCWYRPIATCPCGPTPSSTPPRVPAIVVWTQLVCRDVDGDRQRFSGGEEEVAQARPPCPAGNRASGHPSVSTEALGAGEVRVVTANGGDSDLDAVTAGRDRHFEGADEIRPASPGPSAPVPPPSAALVAPAPGVAHFSEVTR